MLKFQKSSSILNDKSDGLLLCIGKKYKSADLSVLDKSLDLQVRRLIASVCKRGDFAGNAGQVLWLTLPSGTRLPHARVCLVGVGNDDDDACKGMDALAAAVNRFDMKYAMVAFGHVPLGVVEYGLIAMARATYQFCMGELLPSSSKSLKRVYVQTNLHLRATRLKQTEAVAHGVSLTCHLAEQPGNVCTPKFLARAAKALAAKTTLSAKVLEEADIKKLKMGSFMAVAKGSSEPPRLIVFKHMRGARGTPPIALVGKGVTFDTGGISLKPAGAMDEMKFDMCGAATVFGVMAALAKANAPLNVVGIIPACENMPSANATKPGDVVTSMSGKTIEILNTDAEGRLILADALTYAEQQFSPKAVIDIATLTGACVIALGQHTSGLMGHGERLMNDLQTAGEQVHDPCWRLPLGAKYQAQLKTDYADVANIGGRNAGTITAACFLSRFVECAHWAHLDIAGTAWTSRKRATGRPVPLLMSYLLSRAAKQ